MEDAQPFSLRDYQGLAANSLYKNWEEYGKPTIIVAPAGSGKSAILARCIVIANAICPGVRVIVLSHVSEILIQNSKALERQWNNCHVTFYSDKIGEKNLSGQVVFATIQSIYRNAYDFNVPIPDLIFIDECHLLSDNDNSMYRKFLSDMQIINPQMNFCGLTATPFRKGSGYLHKGAKAMFSSIAYEIGILELIERGYLVPVVTPTMQTRMDVTGVKIAGGDYVQSQLERKVDTDPITKSCVDEIVEYGSNRKKWLVFTVGIKHCLHVRDEIRSRGISCEMVTGETPTEERNRIINQHKNGDLRCLVNVTVFTVGFDNPAIDLMASMRPMRSPVLYIQSTGRGMRPYPGKTDCLLLDFGGTVERLGPIDQVRVSTKRGKGEAPHKICPECKETNHAAARLCFVCGFEFPEPELHIEKTASNAAVLSTQLKIQKFPVTHVSYFRHQKPGKPDSVRVEYMSGLTKSFRQWWCFDHTGNAREMACYWWRMFAGTSPPKSVTEALERQKELKTPKEVHVKKVAKYYEVVGVDL